MRSLLDSGSCSRVSLGCNCGDAARGFYRTFAYKGSTVVVASGAPDHRAEHDAPRQNPNTRCKKVSSWFNLRRAALGRFLRF